MSKLVRLAAPVALVLLTTAVWADPLPRARPEQVGLSSERLDRVTRVLRNEIEKGRIPGAVALVARKGKIAYFESLGARDPASGAPMTKDAIFRIYSMTKPITSVAVMMLQEEGRFVLTDPISKFIPQLTKLEVAVERTDATTGRPGFDLVPAQLGLHVRAAHPERAGEGGLRQRRRGRSRRDER
jgi:CubicO group peptidase (beta-lactamase class C family)